MSDVDVNVEEELVVSFEDAEEEQQDSEVIKDLRKRYKATSRELRDLKKAQVKTEEENAPLGVRPTLEDAEYDEDAYAGKLDSWLEQKSQHEAKVKGKQDKLDEETVAWNKRLGEYNDARLEFGDTYEEAEDAVKIAMSEDQQGILVHVLGARLASFVTGMGANPERLKKLAAIKDNALFLTEVGRLDAKMTVKPRKAQTVPQSRVVSDGGSDISVNSILETLREEAEKTGDYTKVMKHKAKLRREQEN